MKKREKENKGERERGTKREEGGNTEKKRDRKMRETER